MTTPLYPKYNRTKTHQPLARLGVHDPYPRNLSSLCHTSASSAGASRRL